MSTCELLLYHGRTTPDEQLDDWGFDGPLLKGVVRIHATYINHIRVKFVDRAAAELAQQITGWSWWDDFDNTLEVDVVDDLIATKDGYYGDWSLTL